MFIYKNSYPKTTKSVTKTNKQQTAASISRIQRSDMSTLIKRQQGSSSSIQRLKIVKKVSVQSAANQKGDDQSSIGKNQRDIVSNSVERLSGVGNSSISVLEQSKVNQSGHTKVQGSQEYATQPNPNYGPNDSSTQIEAQKSSSSKPSAQFRISLKNIEMVGRQQR